jgi:hypothetical protein
MERLSSCARLDIIVISNSPLLSKVKIFSFLKVNLRAVFLELSHGGKAVYCISRKTADGLCNNKVDFTVQGILHHLIEPITVFGIRGRDAFVRKR